MSINVTNFDPLQHTQQPDNAFFHKQRQKLYDASGDDQAVWTNNDYWKKHFERQRAAGLTDKDDPRIGLPSPQKTYRKLTEKPVDLISNKRQRDTPEQEPSQPH
jgi:hypothetical protein